MIFIVTKDYNEDSIQEIKVIECKNKDEAAGFIANWESKNVNEDDSEIIGIFNGKQMKYTTEVSVDVKIT